ERVVVLGLDSVPPSFLFERFRPQMPHMDALLRRALFGTLRTIDPPITVPAWAVMFTGVDPGSLGIYGFRHRKPGTYFQTYSPTPQMLPRPAVWDLLSRAGRRVAVLGMPPGYPPPRVNGVYLSDFLTPESAQDPVWPPALWPEITKAAGGAYRFDVTFRADDRDRIARELFEMTRGRWAVAREIWRREPWDLFALHEIGPDRLHHAFWKYFDPGHPRHEDHKVFSSIADRYYSLLDDEIGAFLDLVGPEVTVLLASDHGSQAMDGCFCINEWLADRGYLTYRGDRPVAGSQLDLAQIDWSRTRAWGAGGYYARIFFNVKGREPEGSVDPAEIPALEAELARELGQVRRENGRSLGARAIPTRTLYRELRGDPPDLMVYFGDLKCRSAGTVGYRKWFLTENDTGPDDSVHSFEGFYALRRAGGPVGHGPERSILDVAPTLLQWLGEPLPAHLQGRPIEDWTRGPPTVLDSADP
ncbi:MAG: alkaline phosphatase family protein, partial [Thermoplasmata archaeon]